MSVHSMYVKIPYCKTFGLKYVRQSAKNNTTSETVDFHKYEKGAIAAIHSLPGIYTVRCKKGYRFSRPQPVIPGQGDLVLLVTSDGKICNLFTLYML
jgi:hypothetical protein